MGSFAVPLSYDEGNWLGVTRRVAAGETLYGDITDNKAPALFGLVRGLDAVPGPYAVARGLWVGALTLIVALAVRAIARRLGGDDRSATIIGCALGFAIALQSVFVVNFEAPAATLLIVALWAMTAGHDITAGVLAASATGFDIRALILLPGIVVAAIELLGIRPAMRVAIPAIVLAGGWAGTVLAMPDLRYSMIELNAATRGGFSGWDPPAQLYAALRGMLLPGALALAFIGSRRLHEEGRRMAPLVLVAGGVIAALASLQPFDKYWSLTIPGVALFAASRAHLQQSADKRRFAVLLGSVGLILALAYSVSTNLDEARLVHRYQQAAAALDRSLGPTTSFARFDTQPFLGTFLPGRDRMPAAVLDFLIADTSRAPANLSRIDRAIGAAAVIVDDGALGQPESSILPAYRPVWRVFEGRLISFPCVRRRFGLTFRYRAATCPVSTDARG